MGFHTELFFPGGPDEEAGITEDCTRQGFPASICAPGRTSPETAAAHLAQLCRNLHQQFLQDLNIPLGANHLAVREALLADQAAGAGADPGTTGSTTPELARARPIAAASSSLQARPRTVTFSQPAPPGQQRRVGLDLQGVITMHGQPGQLVPGSVAGVARLVAQLGRENVSIISNLGSAEAKQGLMGHLHQLDFFSQTHMDSNQVYWARACKGPESKGPSPSQSEVTRGTQERTTDPEPSH